MGYNINLGTLSMIVTGDSSTFDKMMDMAAEKCVALNHTLESVSHVALGVVGSLAALGGWAVHAFSEFDNAMVMSTSIMHGLTDSMEDALGKNARKLAMETTTSAEDLAHGYLYLASAGYDAKQSLAALDTVNKFSVASALDMTAATTYLADSQSALGMKSKDATENMQNMTRIANLYTKAHQLANGSIEDFALAMTNKFGVALHLGNRSLEEGMALLAVYAQKGIKGAAAGEAATIAVRELEKAASKHPDAWKKIGSIYDKTTGKVKPLADIIDMLSDEFGKLSDQQKRGEQTALGFQDRSFSALKALFGTGDQMREFQKVFHDTGDEIGEVSEKRMRSFSAQATILGHNIEDLGISLGQFLVPYLEVFGNFVRYVTDEIHGWVDAQDAATASVGGTADKVSSLVDMIHESAPAFAFFVIAAEAAAAAVKVAFQETIMWIREQYMRLELSTALFMDTMPGGGDHAKRLRADAQDQQKAIDKLTASAANSVDWLTNFQERWNQTVDKIEGVGAKHAAPAPGPAGAPGSGTDAKIPDAVSTLRESIRSNRDFEQINLRAFSLEGGGLAKKAPKKKQEVTDMGVQGKLDQLIDVTKQIGNSPAVAG